MFLSEPLLGNKHIKKLPEIPQKAGTLFVVIIEENKADLRAFYWEKNCKVVGPVILLLRLLISQPNS